jgi:hypothetical protein
LPVASRHNRISALLVALLYVFFSTFGAVAHTHCAAPAPAGAGVGSAAASSRPGPHLLAFSQRECAACEWQALAVTQAAPAHAHVDAPLLRMVPAVRAFSLHTVCLTRFSSRAPPSA